jgi:hypothetical protein
MLKPILTFDVGRILNWKVGRALRPILLFDVSRIFQWDVGRGLRTPIPTILLKGLAGFLMAGLLLAVVVPLSWGRGWHVPEWGAWLLIVACVAAFMGPDLFGLIGRGRHEHRA